ncbi:hypothetical protein PALB_13110 [Pseudoalteromonas luteoviolacea B = ATCC 29581]|nr:hypothetical protein PALB_13110 [Pseudoalteromonas luteoviolacea B = ATCC 29581]
MKTRKNAVINHGNALPRKQSKPLSKIAFFSLFALAGLSSAIVNATTYQSSTIANDDGGGNAIYLDRHSVSCGNDALNSIHLFRPSPTQIAYEYGCTQLNNATNNSVYTPGNDDGGGNVIFLDRHTLNCEGKALQALQLQRPTSNSIQYHYQCSDTALTNITDYFTPANDDGAGNAVYLDRHHVVCPNNEVLSYLRLERPTSTTIRYHYKCGTYTDHTVYGFNGDFAPQYWNVAGVAAWNMSQSALSASVSTGGGGVTAKLLAPTSGKMNFDWNMSVYRAGQYGDIIRYAINGVNYDLSVAGSASGSERNISVQAGDMIEFYTWGTTKSSSYTAVFNNFSFIPDTSKMAPQCAFWGDNQGRNDTGFSGQTFIYQNSSYGTNRFMFNGENKGEVPIGTSSVTDQNGNVFTIGSLVSQPYWDVWYYEICVNK